jgi:hypothetical protein
MQHRYLITPVNQTEPPNANSEEGCPNRSSMFAPGGLAIYASIRE